MNVILILPGVGYFANPSLIFWSQSSGFADSSGEVTLPESWFVSDTPASRRKLASVILYRGAGQVNLQFGGTSTTEAGPELLPAVESGLVITFRQGTNSLILSGISDTTEPYSWVPSNFREVKTFASQVADAGGADCSVELHYVIPVVSPPPPPLSLSGGIQVDARTVGKIEVATPTVGPISLSISGGIQVDVNTGSGLLVVSPTIILPLSLSSGVQVRVRARAELKVLTPKPSIFWAIEASSATSSVQANDFSDPLPVQLGLPGGKGEKGQRGTTGDQGDKGGLGSKGLKGILGQPGDQGDKGGPGTEGQRGIAGQIGDQGEEGSDGGEGLKGILGQMGDQGGRGSRGNRGTGGIKGSRGQGGSGGQRGDRGPSGGAGIKGSKGIMGPDGAPGDLGGPGDRGKKGAEGSPNQGRVGPKGAPGRKGPSSSGAFNQADYNRGYNDGFFDGDDDCAEQGGVNP